MDVAALALTLGGVAMLALTFWEIVKGDTDLYFISEYFWFLDFDRDKQPVVYWIVIVAQALIGLGMIGEGLGLF